MKVNFVLQTSQYIIVTIYDSGNRLLFASTGEKVPRDKWSLTRKRIKKGWPGYDSINAKLDNIEFKLTTFWRNHITEYGAKPNKNKCRAAFDEIMGRAEKKGYVSLYDFILMFIQERENSKFSKNTTKSYWLTYRKMKEYKSQVDWQDITLSYFYGFTDWLYSQDYSQNYVAKIIRVLKTFLSNAADREFHKNYDFRNKRFSVSETKTDQVYLSVKELVWFYHSDLEPRLERVKDLFLVGALTGLRFQDWWSVKPENIINNRLRIKTKKSNMDILVIIPLHPIVTKILTKYDNRLPSISNQRLNNYIKEAARIAGIDQLVTITKNVGGIAMPLEVPKYSLIASHTARRSFITNALNAGVPLEKVMKIAGHKKIATTLKYDRSNLEEAAKTIEQSSLFDLTQFLGAV